MSRSQAPTPTPPSLFLLELSSAVHGLFARRNRYDLLTHILHSRTHGPRTTHKRPLKPTRRYRLGRYRCRVWCSGFVTRRPDYSTRRYERINVARVFYSSLHPTSCMPRNVAHSSGKDQDRQSAVSRPHVTLAPLRHP